MNHLVVFGDSWPHGDELAPGEKTFGELISDALGLTFQRYTQPASSVDHMVWSLRNFLETNPGVDFSKYCALFCITSIERSMTWNQNYWMFQTIRGGFGHPQDNALSTELNRLYWKYFYSPEQALFRANNSIVCLQALCRRYGIKDYYVAGWQTLDLWSEIDLDRFYLAGQVSMADMIDLKMANGVVIRENPYIWPNQSKPNQAGHKIIADTLCKWICDHAQQT